MPSTPTRRSLLSAAALVATAGCIRSEDQPGEGTGNGTDAAGTDTPDGEDGTSSGEAPAFARWSHETPHDALGLVALGGGPETPAIFAGSAAGAAGAVADGTGDGDHALHALALTDGSERWRATLPNPPLTAPLYGDHDGTERLYLGTGIVGEPGVGSAVHALDPESGERRWRFGADTPKVHRPLATTEYGVVVGRGDDVPERSGEAITALGAGSGNERWQVESGDASGEGHVNRRGTLVVTTHRTVRALDPSTGEERWRTEVDAPLDGPVFGNSGKRVFLGHDGTVRALSLGDGTELWRREFEFTVSGVTSPLEALSDTVFVGDHGGRLLALSPLDGGTRWTLSVDREGFRPTVTRTSSTLYVGGAGVHALDPVSGERQWKFTPDIEGYVDAYASTTAFASAGSAGRLWALDPDTGERRWEFAPGSGFAGVDIAGSTAFVGVNGTVHALDGEHGQ